ncbi:hypothetical protein KAZ01_00460 [Candidatus Gracilibacteria bacterium]|nr:hypothetical protein [Candidatus Gracilibacteria bacterium]
MGKTKDQSINNNSNNIEINIEKIKKLKFKKNMFEILFFISLIGILVLYFSGEKYNESLHTIHSVDSIDINKIYDLDYSDFNSIFPEFKKRIIKIESKNLKNILTNCFALYLYNRVADRTLSILDNPNRFGKEREIFNRIYNLLSDKSIVDSSSNILSHLKSKLNLLTPTKDDFLFNLNNSEKSLKKDNYLNYYHSLYYYNKYLNDNSIFHLDSVRKYFNLIDDNAFKDLENYKQLKSIFEINSF